MIVPMTVFQIFNSIAELGAANLSLELKSQIDKLSLKIQEWDYYQIFLEFLTFSEN